MSVNIDDVLSELEGKIGGYAAYYYYQMSDITVKVNPNAFLSTVVTVDGSEQNLEDVASIYQKDEYTAIIAPNEERNIIAIIKALKISHPEYDLEEESKTDDDGKEVRYMLCHMAEVNEDRYNIYVDAINTKYEATMLKINTLLDAARVKLAKHLVGASAETIEQTNDRIKDDEDYGNNVCTTTRDNKLKEVDEGYKVYLERVSGEEQEKAEKQQSRDASLTIDMEK